MGGVDNGRILLNVVVGLPDTLPTKAFRALIDTGASMSCVTPALVEHLGLRRVVEWDRLEGVHGPGEVPIYHVFMGIPISDHHDEPAFIRADPSIRVAEADLSAQGF